MLYIGDRVTISFMPGVLGTVVTARDVNGYYRISTVSEEYFEICEADLVQDSDENEDEYEYDKSDEDWPGL